MHTVGGTQGWQWETIGTSEDVKMYGYGAFDWMGLVKPWSVDEVEVKRRKTVPRCWLA